MADLRLGIGMAFGLGRFGDRRLEKGGRPCTLPWLNGRVRTSAGWVAVGRDRCSFFGSCTIAQ